MKLKDIFNGVSYSLLNGKLDITINDIINNLKISAFLLKFTFLSCILAHKNIYKKINKNKQKP